MTILRVKCLVKDCPNHKDEGAFDGPICVPCATFLLQVNLRAIILAKNKLAEIEKDLKSAEEALLKAVK